MRLLAEIPSALLPPKIDISYHTSYVKLEFRKAEKMGDHQHNPKILRTALCIPVSMSDLTFFTDQRKLSCISQKNCPMKK